MLFSKRKSKIRPRTLNRRRCTMKLTPRSKAVRQIEPHVHVSKSDASRNPKSAGDRKYPKSRGWRRSPAALSETGWATATKCLRIRDTAATAAANETAYRYVGHRDGWQRRCKKARQFGILECVSGAQMADQSDRHHEAGVRDIRTVGCDFIFGRGAAFRLCVDRTKDGKRRHGANLENLYVH